jgi:hypothetical protein
MHVILIYLVELFAVLLGFGLGALVIAFFDWYERG